MGSIYRYVSLEKLMITNTSRIKTYF